MGGKEAKPVYLNSTVITAGVGVTILIIVGGWIYWIASVSSDVSRVQDESTELRSRVTVVENVQQQLTSKQAVLDVKIDTVLEKIQEIKTTIDKNFDK